VITIAATAGQGDDDRRGHRRPGACRPLREFEQGVKVTQDKQTLEPGTPPPSSRR
jgi:hypothetical protein